MTLDNFLVTQTSIVFLTPVYSSVWMNQSHHRIKEKFVEQMSTFDRIHGTDYREFVPLTFAAKSNRSTV